MLRGLRIRHSCFSSLASCQRFQIPYKSLNPQVVGKKDFKRRNVGSPHYRQTPVITAGEAGILGPALDIFAKSEDEPADFVKQRIRRGFYELLSREYTAFKKEEGKREDVETKPTQWDGDQILRVLRNLLLTSTLRNMAVYLQPLAQSDEDVVKLGQEWVDKVTSYEYQSAQPVPTLHSYAEFKDLVNDEDNAIYPSHKVFEQAFEHIKSAPNRFAKDAGKLISKAFIQYLEKGRKPQTKAFDLSNPAMWFPEARAMNRKVIIHVGPTNSGKTYNALEAFKKSKRGYYAGPLRLLAKEVYERMLDSKRPCNLVTGEEIVEQIDPETGLKSGITSGTVEMMDFQHDLDVVVLDEIQMIGDLERGWAWTLALLGVRAKEIHVCGDEAAAEVVQKICAETGDEVEVKKYQRLSPLKKSGKPINLSQVKKGDCVVAFSKKQLFQYKAIIEKSPKFKGKKCAVIYGSLPAEIRTQQARLFNDPDSDYDVLVASDAVGMGLNLAIKRVIFTTVSKYDGTNIVLVPRAQIKQIAGRAGRFKVPGVDNSASDNDETAGVATALSKPDLDYIGTCMSKSSPPITKAMLIPPDYLIKEYALEKGPNTPLSSILEHLVLRSSLGESYTLSKMSVFIEIAKLIDQYPDLSLDTKLTLCKAPVNLGTPLMKSTFEQICLAIARGRSISLLDIPESGIYYLQMSTLPTGAPSNAYEALHRVINMYIWLAYRFPGILLDIKGAQQLNELCKARIGKSLDKAVSKPPQNDRSKLRA
uniref:RNA helicase n=1 Tax=Blastobotrys adeninivorans TaxID=409370 RepID=A0A060TD10_BLAAD